MKDLINRKSIGQKIFMIRGHRVMLSYHLAEMYGVEVRALIQAVKRNIARFPADFMFQLTAVEYGNLKSQSVISSWGGRRRANPYAFTEQGVSMLSSVINSKEAIEVNIAIIRTFVKIRQLLSEQKGLAHKLSELERKIGRHDLEIRNIFDAIKELMGTKEIEPPRVIGFKP